MIGTPLGHYEIQSLLGEGGMGQVFRARDTKLGRAVAIKVLPEAFRADADRAARFEREARLLAALNHPNIAALYGLEEADGRRFLVMELVAGDTLANRLARGPVAVEDALRIALQIAEALEAAHEKGIVHRDLKPANVKLAADDKVKVLDFGLAKAVDADSAQAGITHSPTLSIAATHAGVVLGTAAYMSPEQAKGLPADHRSDIFSFGVVLQEMLTGRQPFQGETAAEVMAAVIVRDTDLSGLSGDFNPRIADLLKRCLEKNPKKRWQAIGDVRAELESIASSPRLPRAPAGAADASTRPWWRRALAHSLTAVVGTVVGAAAIYGMRPASTQPIVTRFSIPLGEGQAFTNTGRQLVTISPDGTKVVYVANRQLWLREMPEMEARPIAGAGPVAQGVTNPVFSPDGQSLTFFSLAEQALKRIPTAGGTAVTLAAGVGNPFGMRWDPSGIWLGQGEGGVLRLSETGGTPEVVLRPAAGERVHGPQLLPGDEWLLLTTTTATGAAPWDRANVVIQSLKTGERRVLLEGATDARYLPTGHLVYAARGSMFAVGFDLRRLQTVGGRVMILSAVAQASLSLTNSASAHWSASERGTLVYLPGKFSAQPEAMLALLNRQGDIERMKLAGRRYALPRGSPDGRRIAFVIEDDESENVWVYDVTGASAMTRLTFGGATYPVWSGDSQYLAFQSGREGDQGIFRQRADTPGEAERLTRPEQGQVHVPNAWSSDGNTLLFSIGAGSTFTLWTYSFRDKKVAPFEDVKSGFQLGAVFSPDGRWVAYHSNETERRQNTVFVRPFPPNGRRYQVAEGANPWWSTDGKELFYAVGPGNPIQALPVLGGPDFRVGSPRAIPRSGVLGFGGERGRNFDSSPDGRLLVVAVPVETTAGPASINAVLNWFDELRTRVPINP